MAAEFGLYYPPWNYTGKPDDLLERVAGEVGIDHVTVPVVTGEVTQFRLCGAFEQPYFHTEGGWHYPPQAGLYRASGVRPRQAKWFGTRDVVGRIRDHTAKLGLKLIFRVDIPVARGVVEDAPSVRYRSAWGELPSFGPCICNPEFRELVRATLADLGRYDPAAFEMGHIYLEPWQRTPVTYWLDDITQLGTAASTCFCSACRQIASMAGLDVEVMAQGVRACVDLLAARPPGKLARFTHFAPNEELQAYVAARKTDCLRWLDRLAESAHQQRMILLEPRVVVSQHTPSLAGSRWLSMGDVYRQELGMLPAIIKGQTKCSGKSCTAGTIPFLEGRKALRFAVWSADGCGSDGLVLAVSTAVRDGVEFFDFEYLDESPPGVTTWLKQAVRYARRE